MNTRTVIALFCLAFATAACGGDEDVDAGDRPSVADLAGSSWEARAIYVDGKPVPIVGDTRVTLVFSEDGSVSGTTGCNSYFGGVSIEGDRISFDQMGMTEMACEPARMEQESVVIAILQSADRWALTDDVLNVGASDGSGGIELVAPVVADADLAATTWMLDTVIDGDAASTPVRGTEVTVRFDPARNELSGNTGCNEFGGEVEIAMPSISVDNLTWTERGCEPAIMDQEAVVLDVLLEADQIEIEGDRLTLTTPDGRGLSYRAMS